MISKCFFIPWFTIAVILMYCNNASTEKTNPYMALDKALENDSLKLDLYIKYTQDDILYNLYYNHKRDPQTWTDDWTDNICLNYENPIVSEHFNAAFNNLNQDTRIRACNIFIQAVAKNSKISNDNKLKWIGEARFCRGLINYFMAQRFGGVHLIDSVINNQCRYNEIPRSTIEETYNNIINDFQNAAITLPDATSTPERATRWTAMAIITRVALQAAAYIPSKRAYYLNLVNLNAKRIINNKGLNLDINYKDIFNDYNKAIKSKEILLGYFAKASDFNVFTASMQYISPNQDNKKIQIGFGPKLNVGFDGWALRFPSQNLVDAYQVIDQDGIAKQWHSTSYYKNYKVNGGYVSSFLYKKRDKRFYATIAHDSSMFFEERILTREKGNMNKLSRGEDSNPSGVSTSNNYIRKGLYEKKPVWYNDTTNHHQPIIRLSEVYLNHAEALIILNEIREAERLINIPRTTHGDLPPLKKLTSVELWNAYKNERRVELSYENDRYWSLLRWAKFQGITKIPELTEPIRGIDISADGKRFSFYNVSLFNNTVNRKFSPNRFLFPFPIE